jgi:hypothetical protein
MVVERIVLRIRRGERREEKEDFGGRTELENPEIQESEREKQESEWDRLDREFREESERIEAEPGKKEEEEKEETQKKEHGNLEGPDKPEVEPKFDWDEYRKRERERGRKEWRM